MKLQFITHYTDTYSLMTRLAWHWKGGCRWIQLRMKEASPLELEQEALRIQALCHQYHATFIIDDHVELAKKIQAHGVHLGKNDMPIAEARKLLGPDFLIGGTANTFEDIRSHHQAGANYIGCGPFRFTTTKKNLSPILGLEGYRYLVSQMKAEKIALPVVAIGLIYFEEIPVIMETGVTGIALSGILRADHPIEETRRIVKILGE